MELAAAAALGKYIGAGLACIAMGGAGIGVGHVAGNFLNGALRNPAAANQQIGNFFVGMAFAEALGIFGFVVALLLLFVV
ncbi:MAG: F0F1 ATP synthase subunit C [Rhodobacteraceae bacterium]|nr:F0F1 ATP synthase subunit C [Paracoccaceae bacterium]